MFQTFPLHPLAYNPAEAGRYYQEAIAVLRHVFAATHT